MNISELERSLRQLRLGGMDAVLENRLRQAQAEPMAPIDVISCLVSDELSRRSDDCWDAVANGLVSAIPTRRSTTLTSLFTPR